MRLGMWSMELFQIVLAIWIAAGIPAVFLLLIYMLDLYASRTFRLVALCFAWGTVGGVGLAYLINTYVSIPLIEELRLDYLLLYLAFAPVVEEVVKSLPVFYVSRRPAFTYFVDGATYGFASGIGFSITENFLYMFRYPEVAIPLVLVRAFSTCLMHGAATAMVGAAVGFFRLSRSAHRRLMTVGGGIAAIVVHALFNGFVVLLPVHGSEGALAAVGIGLSGFALTIFFIFLGLREQQKWLAESLDEHMVDLLNAELTPQEQAWLTETLDQQAGVSVAEVRASQAYEMLEDILDPIYRQFPRQAEQMEHIVLQQAQIGIKRRLWEDVDDAGVKMQLGHEIARLEEDIKRLRKEAGLGAMAYLKCVFDPRNPEVGTCLEELVSCTGDQACSDEVDLSTRGASAASTSG
jgi:RsiW-degrading membrane proteinase PrsW (M82 family)